MTTAPPTPFLRRSMNNRTVAHGFPGRDVNKYIEREKKTLKINASGGPSGSRFLKKAPQKLLFKFEMPAIEQENPRAVQEGTGSMPARRGGDHASVT